MSSQTVEHSKPQHQNGHVTVSAKPPLGHVDWDSSTASNERVVMRSPLINRERIIRDQYVRIEDPTAARAGFLGRIVAGPFFSSHRGPRGVSSGQALSGEIGILGEIELRGELVATCFVPARAGRSPARWCRS